jgi:transcriptional regulator with XRE-family HTH domain
MIGDALRSRRQAQHRTLREVSTAANVSLGYLSEIERGQKEASSELLAAICDALGARLSELLREVSSTMATAEQVDGILAPVAPGTAERVGLPEGSVSTMVDGDVSVTVRQDTPLKATLRATRTIRSTRRDRDVLSAA